LRVAVYAERVDLLQEHIDEAAERGVMFAQAAPWRRAEPVTIEPAGSR